MKKIWTPAEEAAALMKRFEGVKQAPFAREHGVPGGPSMLSQHIHGRRPMNLEHAIAYARGFNVPLEEISPRLARQAAEAARVTAGSPDELGARQHRGDQQEEDVPLSTEKEWRLFRAFQVLMQDEAQADAALEHVEHRAAEVLGRKLLEERLGARGYAPDEKVGKTIKPAPRSNR